MLAEKAEVEPEKTTFGLLVASSADGHGNKHITFIWRTERTWNSGTKESE